MINPKLKQKQMFVVDIDNVDYAAATFSGNQRCIYKPWIAIFYVLGNERL